MDDSEMSVTDLCVSPESVATTVGGGSDGTVGGVGGIQICPALTLGSTQALPIAAKHIYCRLADHAVEIDEGMPNIILSLVSNGNQLSENYLSRFQSTLSVLVAGGGLWLVSSGEYHDPLARTASTTLRAVLPQTERNLEVLHMVVNTTAVTIREESRPMVDAALNTLLILSKNIRTTSEEAAFRANAVVRLAHPPPGEFRNISFTLVKNTFVEQLLLLQDSCELCAVLYNAFLLYRSALFEHSKFIIWLDEQLDTACINDVNAATKLIVKIFAIAFGDIQLIEFLDNDEVSYHELVTVVDMQAFDLNTLVALLLKRVQTSVSIFQHFFTTVVLCQCMGYSSFPQELDDNFVNDLNRLLVGADFPTETGIQKRLSFGVDDLIPPTTLCGDALQHRDPADSVQVLASHDWFFYEESFLRLSAALSASALALVDSVHRSAPNKAYQLLCQPLDGFHGTTLSQLAFQFNMRSLIAHESCQRWLHRLLHGQLQTCSSTILPRWMKMLIAGWPFNSFLFRFSLRLMTVFVFPIRWWMCVRNTGVAFQDTTDKKSPTAALLDISRQPKRVRAVSTYSVVSGRSDMLGATTGSHAIPQLAIAESVTPQSMVFPLNIDDVDGEFTMFTRKPRITRRALPSLCLFYSTPIVKYWLSLVFRLLHISLLAYSVLLPGCGNLTVDALIWMWTFMAWIEAIWVLNMRNHTIPLSLMPWRVLDCVLTLLFLIAMLLFKFVGDSVISSLLTICGVQLLDTVYPVRVLSAFFLLYWCYATIFFYIPLSEVLGPIVVKVKLMILRDFTNFLILVALVMSSSAAAIHAILYPDRDISLSVARSSLSWMEDLLFLDLKESDTCKKAFLGSPTSYCSFVGQYGNTSCPSQSAAGYLVILEYFVLLKLILWPVLFAFFAKTAKTVDEEADKIWKFQMYSLVTDFRHVLRFSRTYFSKSILNLRPPLPPPLTPLFFLCMACRRVDGKLGQMMSTHPEHPDVDHRDRARAAVRFGSVYRNASIPARRSEFVNTFWRELMIDRWKKEVQLKQDDSVKAEIKTMEVLIDWKLPLFTLFHPHLSLFTVSKINQVFQKQLRMVAVNSSYSASQRRNKSEMELVQYADTEMKRLAVPQPMRSWEILLPRYSPPFYCRPVEEFSSDLTNHVEVATEQNMEELRRIWRARQALDSGRDWVLSAAGYPLNPHGRRGSAKDEQLASLLRTIGVSELDALGYSRHRERSIADSSGVVPTSEASPVHIATVATEQDIDTDHAWTEHDVWAIALRSVLIV
ncbi:unnamed protein product [Angiostrongylus costaricensis]|uniref:EOG090X07YB n=1 Tax=Angiostrongylus costaricensis TaxID=334426 RepID=A0A158PIL1_ANGCS|nr:unnamed protein product [Angiostrongylus costaricensis]